MSELIQDIHNRVLGGESINRETTSQLASHPDQEALHSWANSIRRHFMGDHFHLCSIINARSGRCSEDCQFCAQSARYHTGAPVYTMIDHKEALVIAADNEAHAVHRLSLVTSGHSVDKAALEQFAALYAEIRHTTGMKLCASMGFLEQDRAEQLVAMGVSRYHCNLETNEQRFAQVCSTHTWQDKVETLNIASEAGMSLCSGGIIGMGESMEDRMELAFELRRLGIRSIPINILTPIAGTPLADLKPLAVSEVLTTIALFRFINPEAVIRIAGGRQQLAADQYRCFSAGADGAIVGNYLTTSGSSIAEDLSQLRKMGFSVERDPAQ